MGLTRLAPTAHVLLVRGMCAGEVLLPQWIKANLVQVHLSHPKTNKVQPNTNIRTCQIYATLFFFYHRMRLAHQAREALRAVLLALAKWPTTDATISLSFFLS